MWIARLFPEKSKRYDSGSTLFQKMDPVMDYLPFEWYSPWILFGAGVGWRKAVEDRYYFWDFSGWTVEIITALIITVLFSIALKKTNYFSPDKHRNTPWTGMGIFLVLGIGLFLLGWFGNPLTGIKIGIPYFLCIPAVYVIFLIPLEKDEHERWQVGDQSKRIMYNGLSLVLLLAALVLGWYQDEPVITTATGVFIPFVIVSLVSPQPRHIRRSRIYSIFIFGFFISMRAPWLLVMMFIHFHGLRFYHYFRYGIVYPTLMVEAKEDLTLS